MDNIDGLAPIPQLTSYIWRDVSHLAKRNNPSTGGGMKEKPPAVVVYIRVPQPMKQWLDEQAEENCNTINVEIVRAIRDKMRSQQEAQRATA